MFELGVSLSLLKKLKFGKNCIQNSHYYRFFLNLLKIRHKNFEKNHDLFIGELLKNF